MAKLPTMEESAKNLLQIFIKRNRRPGECLLINVLQTDWNNAELEDKAFKEGLDYAIDQGWIEEKEINKLYCITDEGFSKS